MPLTLGMLPGRGVAISYVNSGTSATSTITIPTHQVGDLIIIQAINSAASTKPTVPGTFTSITTANTTGAFGSSAGYIIATTNTTTSGTWTNADRMMVVVYRGVSAVGNTASDANNISNVNMSYPAVTFAVSNGTSWACCMGQTKGTQSPGTPGTNTSRANGTTYRLSDTNAGVTGWSTTATTLGAGSLWATLVIELKD